MNDSTPAFPANSPLRSSAAPGKSLVRRAVPLTLFVLIVGGIAWLVQNMPSWRGPKAPVEAPRGPEAFVAFLHPTNRDRGYITAIWNKENPSQSREFEKGTDGSYYYPFMIHPDKAPELGVTQMSCDCAKLHVAVIPEEEWKKLGSAIFADPGADVAENPAWTWQALEKNVDKGIALPSGGHALLRMSWNNRKSPGEQLNLKATVWFKQGVQRQEFGVYVPAVSTEALRVRRDRSNVGILGPGGSGKAEFVLWSPTRDQATLRFPPETGALLQIQTTALDVKERSDLDKKLRDDKIETLVRSAWRVNITVHEHKGEQWLDQGHFLRAIPVGLEGDVEGEKLLTVTGVVRNDVVQIGGSDDQGKINLGSFPVDVGRSQVLMVTTTDPKIEFEQPPSCLPAAVKVKLTENVKERTATRRKWVLEVVVPPNQLFGTLSDESAVILRIKSTPPRQIRIPLTGHAVQSSS